MTKTSEPWFPIQTARLCLRDFRESDVDAVQDYAADPEVCRFMPWGPNTRDDTRAFLDRALSAQRDWPRLDYNLAIEHREAAVVIGSIALHLFDAPNRTLELGYCLHRSYWRLGLATEAARALLRTGFQRLDAHRIVATCNTQNLGSFGVMETLGMRREGWLRQDRMIKGAWRDTYVYALLAEEWAGRGLA